MTEGTPRRKRQSRQENGDAFAQHREQDVTLGNHDEEAAPQGMSFVARTLIFLAFPLFAGTAGLYVGYLRTIRDPDSKINFDTDFVFPFLLALALVMVIAFQTKGFSKTEVTPLIQWPKVRRKRRIIRKRIILDDDGNPIKEEGKND